MKMKKIISTVMAALLAVMVLVQPASAFDGPYLAGQLLGSQATQIGDGFVYKSVKTTDRNGAKQALFYGEYKSSATSQYEWVVHNVTTDSGDVTRKTVLQIAQDYEAKTGKKVIFGTNGDYFDWGSGRNIESFVRDDIVQNKGAYTYKHCIGFDNNGKFVLGRMTETEKYLMLVIEGQRYFFKINAFNTDPGENGIAIYDMAGEYLIKNAGVYTFKTSSTNLNSYPLTGTVQTYPKKTVEDKNLSLISERFAMVVRGDYAEYFKKTLKYGTEVQLVEVPAGDYAGCNWVLGGYDILVDNGVVNTNCHTDNSGNSDADRTFIGVKEDGTMFLCAIDGRQVAYSCGLRVSEEATLAKELGAKWALELDGGGSTTVILRDTATDTLKVMNHSSDVLSSGACRAVSNAILLVERSDRQGITTPVITPTEPDVPGTTAPGATTAPNEPTTAPNEPTTAPNEPTTAPNEPTTAPTEPTTAPTEPATQPTNPGTEPSDEEGGSTAVVVVAAAAATVSVGGSIGAVVWFILRKKRGV